MWYLSPTAVGPPAPDVVAGATPGPLAHIGAVAILGPPARMGGVGPDPQDVVPIPVVLTGAPAPVEGTLFLLVVFFAA